MKCNGLKFAAASFVYNADTPCVNGYCHGTVKALL